MKRNRCKTRLIPKSTLLPIPQTGQVVSYSEGDDGAYQYGIAFPNPRFTEDGETVTDNMTGLVWLKNTNWFKITYTWGKALAMCKYLSVDTFNDWRLPNVRELMSLVDYGHAGNILPAGHPFYDVRPDVYWSSTTFAADTNAAFAMHMQNGAWTMVSKKTRFYVWPVRGPIERLRSQPARKK